MALELQNAATVLVVEILSASEAVTPAWLVRPGKLECGKHWGLVQGIYADLTGGFVLPATMPPRESRRVDYVLVVDGKHRILEVDEKQHFNRYRAATLSHYADSTPVAFPADAWVAAGNAKKKLEGGGFGKPKPPLFPEQDGRHQQRAFRDALADILPVEYGWLPTLRIADFEIKDWIFGSRARERMDALLAERL